MLSEDQMDTDGADAVTVLEAVLMCACSWAPEARIIGNVRAGDIAAACLAAIDALHVTSTDQ